MWVSLLKEFMPWIYAFVVGIIALLQTKGRERERQGRIRETDKNAALRSHISTVQAEHSREKEIFDKKINEIRHVNPALIPDPLANLMYETPNHFEDIHTAPERDQEPDKTED